MSIKTLVIVIAFTSSFPTFALEGEKRVAGDEAVATGNAQLALQSIFAGDFSCTLIGPPYVYYDSAKKTLWVASEAGPGLVYSYRQNEFIVGDKSVTIKPKYSDIQLTVSQGSGFLKDLPDLAAPVTCTSVSDPKVTFAQFKDYFISQAEASKENFRAKERQQYERCWRPMDGNHLGPWYDNDCLQRQGLR